MNGLSCVARNVLQAKPPLSSMKIQGVLWGQRQSLFKGILFLKAINLLFQLNDHKCKSTRKCKNKKKKSNIVSYWINHLIWPGFTSQAVRCHSLNAMILLINEKVWAEMSIYLFNRCIFFNVSWYLHFVCPYLYKKYSFHTNLLYVSALLYRLGWDTFLFLESMGFNNRWLHYCWKPR